MCEESACLVPPLEHARQSPPEPRLSASNGSAIGVHGEALVGFHEDALSQAAVGRAQLLLTLVLGLGLAADCSEFVVLSFILPAAELELCIDDHRKGWLGSITILAMAIGSLCWGILGDRLGRRRALLSALSVAVLFSSVAAVMPTYGTFMMARFCSGLGVAGAFPLTFNYLSETCPRATRTRYTGLLHTFWPLGALFTSTLAHLTIPEDGAQTVVDNREHWSSWHRLLLLTVLPTLGCIVGLIWASESPRYLLEASREVEALQVYQRLHKLNKARTQYGLTELELPGRSAYRERPVSPASRNVFGYGMDTIKDAFQRISSPTHFRTTLLLAALHLLLGFVYSGVSTFTPLKIREYNDQQFNSHKKYVSGAEFEEMTFNATIVNVQYSNSFFKNVTFSHLEFSHVEFINCYLYETEFVNVKSSKTFFENTTIKESRFIDTDLSEHHFINCQLTNNTFLSLISECVMDFDYNIYLRDLYQETIAWAGPMIPSLLLLGFILSAAGRPPIIAVLLFLSGCAGVAIFFLSNFATALAVEAVVKGLLICAVNAITMVVVEGYPCHLRCTAHGLMRTMYHLAALCAIPIYTALSHAILLFPAVITVSMAFMATILSTKIQDNSKVLL